MTRPPKKYTERSILVSVLKELGSEFDPSALRLDSEKPDFRVPLAGRVVGVELTEYRNHAQTSGGFGRPVVEGSWQRFREQARALASSEAALRGLDVRMEFQPLRLPPRTEWHDLIQEIVAVAEQRRTELAISPISIAGCSTGSPLLRKYVRRIALQHRGSYADWHWNGDTDWLPRLNDDELRGLIHRKANKGYGDVAELWLIVHGGLTISSQFPNVDSVAELRAMNTAAAELDAGPYTRVILWDRFRPGRTYQWQKGVGWAVL